MVSNRHPKKDYEKLIAEFESMTTTKRVRLVARWSDSPARNPRYRGATPAQVARVLLRKSGTVTPPEIKTHV